MTKKGFKKIPAFMRSEVSKSFLYRNPQYKLLFKLCPSCNKISFKKLDINNLSSTGRKCSKCGYYNSDVE